MAERLYAYAQAWEALGFLGLCMLALVFVLGTLTFMPRFTFYAIGGLVFGLAAIPAAVIGSTVGATLAFLLARTVLRGAFQRQVDKRPAWRKTLAAIDAEGWRLVVLTRFAAPLPGGAINYLFGLTGIGVRPYAAATFGGLIPPVALFASLGALGRVALQNVEQSGDQGAVAAAGVIVIAVTALLIIRRMRATPSPPG